jgi:KipI family sensor histidine kinase inhibitor
MNEPNDGLPSHAYGADTYPRFMPVGDFALTVEFGDVILPGIHAAVLALDMALAVSEVPGVTETAPSYRSLLVCYEPAEISFSALVAGLRLLLARPAQPVQRSPRQWTVPVLYGEPSVTDLDEVAGRLGLSPAEVVEMHAGADYVVYFVGAAPGLPMMGGLPAALQLPRRPQPRPRIPARSVVMAGPQAAVISTPMPSGWHILGHTPVRPFDLSLPEPFLFRPGDLVRFRPIDRAGYDALEARAERGETLTLPEAAL